MGSFSFFCTESIDDCSFRVLSSQLVSARLKKCIFIQSSVITDLDLIATDWINPIEHFALRLQAYFWFLGCLKVE